MAATTIQAGMINLATFWPLFLPSGSVVFLVAVRVAVDLVVVESRVGRGGIWRSIIGVARIVCVARHGAKSGVNGVSLRILLQKGSVIP